MKTAILVTGGMDSTTLLHVTAQSKEHNHLIYPITVDYGHTAFPIQLRLITHHVGLLRSIGCTHVQAPTVIKIEFHDFQRYSTDLFEPGAKCREVHPLGDYDKMRYRTMLIEGRNALMVLNAVGFCAHNQIDELLAGYLYGVEEWDRQFTIKLLLGDNSPAFVDAINLLIRMGFSHPVRFRAPFYEARLTKEQVHGIGVSYNVPFDMTHSCYFPEPCGKCDNCLLRAKILGEGK